MNRHTYVRDLAGLACHQIEPIEAEALAWSIPDRVPNHSDPLMHRSRARFQFACRGDNTLDIDSNNQQGNSVLARRPYWPASPAAGGAVESGSLPG